MAGKAPTRLAVGSDPYRGRRFNEGLPSTWIVTLLLVSIASLLVLSGCRGPQGQKGPQGSTGSSGVVGAKGPQGVQGATGELGSKGPTGKPGIRGPQGLQGQPGPLGPRGLQGQAASADASILVSSQILYLTGGIEIWGSGFEPSESVNVYIDVDGNTQPNLGFADANAGGAWSLQIGRLDEVRGVSQNTLRLTQAEVLTLMAEGSDGTKTSIPVVIRSEPLDTAESNGHAMPASLVAGTVEAGKVITVYGAGYKPSEVVTLEIAGLKFGSSVAGKRGALGEDISIVLEPGMYTLMGVGDKGSVASAPLIVMCSVKVGCP